MGFSNLYLAFKNKINNAKHMFLIMLSCSLLSHVSLAVYANDAGTWVKVDEASIKQSEKYTQRRVGYYTYNDIVVNADADLSESLRLVVTNTSHSVSNADGMTVMGQPYFDVEDISVSTQIYFSSQRGAFHYSTELQQYILPDSNTTTFNYDFNTNEIQTENNNGEGWVYPTVNRGVITFAQGASFDDSAAYLFEDTSANTTISQTGIRFNNRTNQANINPWTDLLSQAQGLGVHRISFWVKVEKATPGEVTVQHHLIPYPVVDDNKGIQIKAGIELGPEYQATIAPQSNGQWVKVELVDRRTGAAGFNIPESWRHFDGNSSIQVYPDLLFGGLEVGDKVYIDNYQAVIGDADPSLPTGTGDEEEQSLPYSMTENTFSYNFNVDQIQTENNNWEGWVYPTRNRGVMAFEEGQSHDSSSAYSYQDTSTNSNIAQNGIRFNNRTNQPNVNPWTDFLGDAHGKEIGSVSLWVKVEKATPGNVTVQHQLVPYPLIDGTKGEEIAAGVAVSPQYEMVIPASENGNWVQIEFVDTTTGDRQFTIPENWVHVDGESPIQVYPQFLFGGLEVGDKVYIDDYLISDTPLEAPCCEPVAEGDGSNGSSNGGASGGGSSSLPQGNFNAATGGISGGSNGNVSFNLGDQLTFTYNFDVDETTTSQGEQGWIYSVLDRGQIEFESGNGQTNSAFSYQDISANINPEQNGLLLQDWSANSFTAMFGKHGNIINTVSMWVKTELIAEKDIEIIHYLIPYGLVQGNKSVNYPAGIEASPRLVGVIPAGSTDWVKIDFVIDGTQAIDFTIPSTWFHASGGDLQIYPEFKFANTEVGDKIYLDSYQATSTVGEPLAIPTDFTIDYDFEAATVAQNGGWGFIANGFGNITLEQATGFNSSQAISYTDINDGTAIINHSLLWHKWGNTNPWSKAFGNGQIDAEIRSVALRVKVVKGTGNNGNEPVTIKHHLLPWNISGSNKFEKVAAAQAVTADYTAEVAAENFGDWININFIDANTGLAGFTIPDSWQLSNGSDIVDVLPAFFFGGLETGDKVIIDDYVLIGDNEFAHSVTTGIGGEWNGPDYGFHDGSSTYTNNPRPQPLPIVDSDFYTPPSSFNVEKNAVTDYGVNNTDTLDDTASVQSALDEISQVHGGGKLTLPAGDYYFRSLHLRSNVHLEVEQGTVFYMVTAGSYNEWMFEMGNSSQGKAQNVSLIGLGSGFTIDLRNAPNIRTAVFKMGDIENFKFANFTIEDGKTIFASFLVGITERDNDIHWPVNGIIEDIRQYNSLFGYGLAQMYGADNILFRNIHSEGGITLRIETDNLTMKDYGKGGVRSIFAENVSGTDCLAPLMFGPHFQENGSVQVNGVTANGCGQAVRVDGGFVELFSPAGQAYTRDQWREEVNATYGEGCSAQPYKRGVNQWAARINHINDCLDKVHQRHNLKPGWFAESYIYNVTAHYGTNAHLKQNQLDYFFTTNPSCADVCLPAEDMWSGTGQIYLGPSTSAVIDHNEAGADYHFNINIEGLEMIGFPVPSIEKIDNNTNSGRVCDYYGMQACPAERWDTP